MQLKLLPDGSVAPQQTSAKQTHASGTVTVEPSGYETDETMATIDERPRVIRSHSRRDTAIQTEDDPPESCNRNLQDATTQTESNPRKNHDRSIRDAATQTEARTEHTHNLKDVAIQTGDVPSNDDPFLHISPYDLAIPIWVPDQLLGRLQTILDSVGKNRRYALSRVPRESTWSVHDGISKLSVDGEPITIMVLGALRAFKLDVDDDADKSIMTVSVDLLRDVDRDTHQKLCATEYHSHSTSLAPQQPARHGKGAQGLEQTYFTAQAHGRASGKPLPNVYDATTQVGTRVNMRKSCLCALATDDIVLLETIAELRAYGGDGASVTFTLKTVSVIAFSPRPGDP
ncbi:uncharacterized protein TRAVEDRAFT_54580 [Trametes versicolor FP-101664 SS1]|uniref:Uncharacterized protein n=1 Tax=Trametes versicolor (strain FP-101664) TaxID=717944 RepID=R7S758_TRAVS|nr:uncharacterized protein TRAVEDRAFT_54580 [Trametes versicolor FP-101664 SS1]EIW51422.1 hypothetical protein TRAVEDRAFT_54580 [Trametes versicolor FP-101664 SS1]